MQVSIGEIRLTWANVEPDSTIFKGTKILGTACEFGLSLISLALASACPTWD